MIKLRSAAHYLTFFFFFVVAGQLRRMKASVARENVFVAECCESEIVEAADVMTHRETHLLWCVLLLLLEKKKKSGVLVIMFGNQRAKRSVNRVGGVCLRRA